MADGIVTAAPEGTNFPTSTIAPEAAFFLSDSWACDSILFVFEAGIAPKSQKTIHRQLVTYLITGLKHRRALGMKDAPLYGATLLDERFTLYVAVWEGDKIVVHPTGHFWFFSRAIEIVDCYLHLCALAHLIARQLRECLELPQEDVEAARRRAITDSWRPGEGKSGDTNEVTEMDEEMDEEISEEADGEMGGDDLNIAALSLVSTS